MSEWVQGRYSNWRRRLDGGLHLSAWYDGIRRGEELQYLAAAGDMRLKKRFRTLAEAQAAAEALGRRICEQGLADLGSGRIEEFACPKCGDRVPAEGCEAPPKCSECGLVMLPAEDAPEGEEDG